MPPSGSASPMPRTGCSRWSCSGATAPGGWPRSSARGRGRRSTGRCGCSASTAPPRPNCRICRRRCSAALEAYAAGVNAFLATRRGALPPEFLLLRFAPEPWRPADSLVWGKLMDLQLAGNYRGELLRARLARTLSPEDLAFLYPEYPKDAPTTLAALAPIYRRLPLDRALRGAAAGGRADLRLEQLGRRRRAQRERQAAPRQRPASRLRRAGLLVSRAAEDAGARDRRRHRRRRAVRRDRPQRPHRLGLHHDRQRCRGSVHREARSRRSRPLSDARTAARRSRRAQETIAVRGAAPVDADRARDAARPGAVRRAAGRRGRARLCAGARGDLSRPPTTAAPRRCGASTAPPTGRVSRGARRSSSGRSRTSSMPMPAARSASSRRAACRSARSGDGWLPVPGWTGEYDWTGLHPVRRDCRRRRNPPSGHFVSANNKIVPDGYPYFLSAATGTCRTAPSGSATLLAATPLQTPAASAAIQADTLSLDGRAAGAADDPRSRRRTTPRAQAIERLRHWDFRMDRDKVEPLLFTAWLRAVQPHGPVRPARRRGRRLLGSEAAGHARRC